MDRVHRKELKHDAFVDQVGHGVEYAVDHRTAFIRWTVGAAVAVLAGIGIYAFMSQRAEARQADFQSALKLQEASVGPAGSEFFANFPTQGEKDAALQKSFTTVADKYSGNREGILARLLLGVNLADQGKVADAEKHLKIAAESSDKEAASQAKLSLAQLYDAQGRTADAEKLLRSLIDSPTMMVSKVQATVALARVYAPTKPAEARKLLEPLRTERGAISRVAITALGEIPAAR